MKLLTYIFTIGLLISCDTNKSKSIESDNNVHSDPYVDPETIKAKEDSINQAKEKQIETELQNLRDLGIFGKWECSFRGYESIITLQKTGSSYKAEVDFTKNNLPTRNQILKKSGNKYAVADSKAKDYYVINNDGDLELWDKDGLITTAKNIMPGVDSKSTPTFDISSSIGQNIFTVRGNYSQSSPETLFGTNNDFWIVYLSDLNTTFKVDKKTDKILKAKEGRVNNLN